MERNLEKSNKEKTLRRLAKKLALLGIKRTKPTFFVRINGPVAEFIHIHKFSFGPYFRIHVCLRVLNDPMEFIGLTGLNSDQPEKWSFEFTESIDSIDRCVQKMEQFILEKGEPWFKLCSNTDFLIESEQSPLTEVSKKALGAAINCKESEGNVSRSKSLLGTRVTRCSNTVPALRASTRQFVSSAFSESLRNLVLVVVPANSEYVNIFFVELIN